ncbi:MAG: sigma-54-dependent Fis family transcriptional regulator [Xanthomonadales bacterium]|nr:Regulatory protein AtoC [Xanthomonadales bacterium]MCC6592245.1 sigma-54-dependent Fis family transcriptional regulator [Xanthomonadales bacterium]MCE7930689.1 sigma-54-dependent Fis family transcriptional regulator [Xanthomonadales bacterium PRO6]
MEKGQALILDDEADIRELLTLTLTRLGLTVHAAATLGEARALLGRQSYDLCFTDMRLPDGNGHEFIELMSRQHPDTPVAMITAYGNAEAAVQALRAGAFDCVSKPVDLNVLRNLVKTALRLRAERVPGGGGAEPRLFGDSPAMQRARATIAKLARSQAPVLIYGESGVGKELAARSIHEQGPRAAAPFVPVNCGAIPTELMESEFFGHKKGSFTGAHGDKDGLIQAAHGGTLFLDEIAELPPHMQVKLLRVIQEKTVRPIGARAEIPVDVRIVSATHKDLARLVDQGDFRQDLYYRINVIELRMPPLRERREDIAPLAERYLDKLAPEWSITRPRLAPDALAALNAYDYPGNVRELENILERAVALSDGDVIRADDLQLSTRAPVGSESPPPAAASAPPPEEGGALAGAQRVGLENYIDTLEREAINKALEECRYNKTAAAKKLGITFRALRYRLKKLGID